ncbi:hypothetical protein J4226_05535 [Candidatus Pacearchaeota archaeon]|nr:hypothetical protein [Candidatus Pacearchaeota archaeon]
MFVAWEHNDLDGGLHYYHLGIIIRTNPIIIVHRNGFLGSVEREFLDGIGFDYDASRIKYLIPKRLEALL